MNHQPGEVWQVGANPAFCHCEGDVLLILKQRNVVKYDDVDAG